ncbi:MAG TPA: FAD binding domain-containing protein [Nocardioidaceae bacterium]|nr:FAD binding domain-containing protein [Nocardioidaceae bacterium]
MKPAAFAYSRPVTVDEALRLLAAGDAKVLAGGQSLVPILSMRLASPASVVDINHVAGLDAIEVDGAGVRIGALTRHRALEQDQRAFAANPLLRRTLECVAHPTIRNRGTTVGSLVHADPSAEMPAVLALLGGEIEVVSEAVGRRTIAACDFVVGPMESTTRPDELAVSAWFPHPPPRSGSSWREVSRRHGDYAVAGVGAIVTLGDGDTVASARLAFISVAVVPVCVDVSEALAGQAARSLDVSAVAEFVSAAIDPEPDIHATAEYRAHLARVLAGRALCAAAADAVERSAA